MQTLRQLTLTLFPPPRTYPVDSRGRSIPADVCDLFEKLALRLIAEDWDHYSSDALLHQIRWHERVEKNNRAFVINDHWSSVLARWFLALHPECPKFFELRERLDDGYQQSA